MRASARSERGNLVSKLLGRPLKSRSRRIHPVCLVVVSLSRPVCRPSQRNLMRLQAARNEERDVATSCRSSSLGSKAAGA